MVGLSYNSPGYSYSEGPLPRQILDIQFHENRDRLRNDIEMMMEVRVPNTSKAYTVGCSYPLDMQEQERHLRFTELCREAMIGMLTLKEND